MQKMQLIPPKYPVCNTLPCVFGSTLTPRAFNHFNNNKNSKITWLHMLITKNRDYMHSDFKIWVNPCAEGT